jgi:hypothetical protein
MSRAARVPRSRRVARVRVSEHALVRFRERVAEAFLHREDDDLRFLLDEYVRHAPARRTVADPRAPGMRTDLVAFDGRGGRRYWAVVREGTVVTVLDDGMAARNFGAVP